MVVELFGESITCIGTAAGVNCKKEAKPRAVKPKAKKAKSEPKVAKTNGNGKEFKALERKVNKLENALERLKNRK